MIVASRSRLLRRLQAHGTEILWVAVKERLLSYHSPETILLTIYPYYDNLN